MTRSKIFPGLLACAGAVLLITTFTACQTATKVDPATGQTNVVKTVDEKRLEQIRDIIEPGAAAALRAAIANSPQHEAEIRQYAGAIASIACQMQQSGNFSVDYLITAADKATADLQAKAAGDPGWTAQLVNAKGVLIGVYKAAAADDLSWQLPDNAWLRQVTALICNSVTAALGN